MTRNPKITRLMWRVGRNLYMRARGEELFGDIARNGEAYLQKRFISSAPSDSSLIVMDIGANQGDWTESFLNALPEERRSQECVTLHAFEPVPSTAVLFQKRIRKLTGHEIVKLHQLAMSDAPGQADIGVFVDGGGTNSLHHSADARTPEQIIRIDLDNIDGFCEAQGIDHIDIVKCDTEGHDAKVLSGAHRMLHEERIDILQFEYNHRWVYGRAFLKDAFDLVEGLPYDVVRLDETGLTLFQTWHPELERFFQSNYALVHRRVLGLFNVHRGRFDESNTYA